MNEHDIDQQRADEINVPLRTYLAMTPRQRQGAKVRRYREMHPSAPAPPSLHGELYRKVIDKVAKLTIPIKGDCPGWETTSLTWDLIKPPGPVMIIALEDSDEDGMVWVMLPAPMPTEDSDDD